MRLTSYTTMLVLLPFRVFSDGRRVFHRITRKLTANHVMIYQMQYAMKNARAARRTGARSLQETPKLGSVLGMAGAVGASFWAARNQRGAAQHSA
mmetsp:Transcript_30652/g.59111  ORF Transcript_30652/g.59111 Transcript_30652/m.59111 type:complete len:95 (-) Transcript_30652:987-1271(-)